MSLIILPIKLSLIVVEIYYRWKKLSLIIVVIRGWWGILKRNEIGQQIKREWTGLKNEEFICSLCQFC